MSSTIPGGKLMNISRERYMSWKGGKSVNTVGVNPANVKYEPDAAAHVSFKPNPIRHYRLQYTSSDTDKGKKSAVRLIDRINSAGAITHSTVESNTCGGIIDFYDPASSNIPTGDNDCCSDERKASERVLKKSIVDQTYFTTMSSYLENRCKLFRQRQFNFAESTLTAPEYRGDCNRPMTEGCSVVIYKPNNPKFAVQGAVESSTRLARLKYDAINVNGASFTTAFGRATCASGQYRPEADTPYTLKSKTEPVNGCRSIVANMRRGYKPGCFTRSNA